MPVVIGFISQKGGVSKSTLARLTAREYANVGQVLYHGAMIDPNDLPKFDAGTYQKPLGALAEVLALKLSREATKLIRPAYAAIDMHVMLRVTMRAYDLLHYINADERREKDTDWRLSYTISSLPLIRNMIDCLYNITAILQDPE